METPMPAIERALGEFCRRLRSRQSRFETDFAREMAPLSQAPAARPVEIPPTRAEAIFRALLVPDLARVLRALDGRQDPELPELFTAEERAQAERWGRIMVGLADERMRNAATALLAHRLYSDLRALFAAWRRGDPNAIDVMQDDELLHAWVNAKCGQAFERAARFVEHTVPLAPETK